ncbi:hypothetical protein F5Y06DRAFT_302806 [Hypoxylon sp. FL0890]|nr:hypothetical protein F5Y06DRAFT_302806 [Hypoxylon sp. FL0890]
MAGKEVTGPSIQIPGLKYPFQPGIPTPVARMMMEGHRRGKRLFKEGGSDPFEYGAGTGRHIKRFLEEQNSFMRIPPSSPVPASLPSLTSINSPSSGIFNKEGQVNVRDWLRSATCSNQDPNLLSPFSDCPSPNTDSSASQQSPQSSVLPEGINGPLPEQDPSSAPRESSLDWPFSQGTSSLPITQNKVKRVRFSNSIKMDLTPQRGRGAVEQDMARARAASRGEPFHSRSVSHSQQDRTGGMLPYYNHGRDNSLASSRTYQQLGRVSSPERGRSLQRRYEFQSSDSDNALSPVFESGMDNRQSHVTTMTEIIDQGQSAQRARSMSRHKSPPKPVGYTSIQLKDKRRPAPLDLEDARKYGTVAVANANIQPIHNPVSPTDSEMVQAFEDGNSSEYTNGTVFPSYEAPLRAPEKPGMSGVNILQGYNDWRENQPAGEPVAVNGYLYSKGTKEHENGPEMSNRNAQEFQGQPAKEAISRPSNVDESSKEPEEPEAPPFTPLTPYLMNTRVATKTLIGDKGWLEDTAAQAKKPESKKSTTFMGNVKKTARKIAEITEFRAGQPKTHTARGLNISLDPREQSLLYCELEFILSNTLSGYINIQLHSGRLNPHIHAKISDMWEQKGRPKVTGFRYDLETQIDMVAAHVGAFRFYGPHQTNLDMIKGLLYGMKMNARVMRIRTYCQPDPVIAKHILDAQALTQLLDSPESVQVPLAEVAQFFKVVIEREQDARMKREAEQSFVEYTPNAGVMPRNPETLSPPKGKYPGEYGVKNQTNVPVNERNFSGPILEPKVYDPSQTRTQTTGERQPWYGA